VSEVKKVTDEELNQIKDLGNKYNAISTALGQLRVQKIILNQQLEQVEKAEENLENDYVSTQEKEQSLVQSLNENYGTGTLNPQTGEFTVTQTQEKTEENEK
jgi:hypothetical protein|tara:strand:- start:239 stop:544 length:306 start_codon:yes stop_codon:yes gene_type:complete